MRNPSEDYLICEHLESVGRPLDARVDLAHSPLDRTCERTEGCRLVVAHVGPCGTHTVITSVVNA